jgi:hypothetical protein
MARNFVSMLWLTDPLSLDERVNRVGQVILQATAIAAKNPVKGHPILVTIAMRYLSTRKLGAVGLLAISAFAYANAGSKFITIQTKGYARHFQASADTHRRSIIIESRFAHGRPRERKRACGQLNTCLLTSSPMVNIVNRMRHPIANVADAVRALGGTTVTADLLCVSKGYVSQMAAENEFKPHFHYRILKNLQARGFLVDEASLFGDVVKLPETEAEAVA